MMKGGFPRWLPGTCAWLVVIATCSFFAAKAVSAYLAAGPAEMTWKQQSTVSEDSTKRRRTDGHAIVQRNPFCSNCTPAPVVGPKDNVDTDQRLAGIDHLQLIVTLVSEEDPAWSFVVVRDGRSNESRLYGQGARIGPEGPAVVSVEDRRVELEQDGRRGYLELMVEGRSDKPGRVAIPPRFTGAMKDLTGGIRKVAEGRYEIDRTVLKRALTRTHALAKNVRIIPRVKKGKPAGFTLYRIRPGSLFAQLGMFNGDAIHAVNNRPMLTPEGALALFTKLQSASHLTISFDRRGKTLTHDYTIR